VGADPAVVVDTADVVPDGEVSPETAAVLAPPRQVPRFDDGDMTVNPAVGDDDADRQRPRTNDRRPPRTGANREVRQSGDSHVDTANRRSRRRRGRERGDVQSGQEAPWSGELVPVKGLLDLRDEGYGFLRTGGYLPSMRDVYVSVSQARRLALRRGDAIEGACRPAGPSEKYPALIRVDTVSGSPPTRPGCAPASRTSRRCSLTASSASS